MSADRFCLRDGITTAQDAITRTHSCVVETRTKAEFEGECDPQGPMFA